MNAPIVAVVGGGQLARMMQEEASALGIHLRALVEAADGSTGQVTVDAPVGAADDEAAVRALVAGRGGAPEAGQVLPAGAGEPADVLTFEHEHQDSGLLARLRADGVSVQPGPDALLLARDKLAMRRALDEAGLPQPAWEEVGAGDGGAWSPADGAWDGSGGGGAVDAMARQVQEFARAHGWPVVLKTPRGGYDGHGVLLVGSAAELARGEARAWLESVAAARDGRTGAAAQAGGGGSLGGAAVDSLLVEQAVPFTREIAVLLARSPSGQVEVWPVAQTVQEDGMCAEVIAPAPGLATEAQAEARRIGEAVALAFSVTGVLAVEMFVVEGEGVTRLYVNELAMRPHNSGHWTQDGAVTSQFAQHLRAVLDLPLGSAEPTAPLTVMVNLLGGEREPGADAMTRALALEPRARIHLYGKGHRPGRKLGHVNITGQAGESAEALLARARDVVAVLRGDA